jgi:molecular chaperone GrpE
VSDPRNEQPEDEGVRVTDRRRIDPQTGAVRAPAGSAAAGFAADDGATVDAELADADLAADDVLADAEAIVDDEAVALAEARAAELTDDLQRLAAEYKNYRERVQREIADARLRGRADVVSELIASLDDLDRAAEHGDLTGPAKALADNLNAALAKLGVERYGSAGEPFDPIIHEAMTHAAGEGFDGPTVTAVYQPGYRMGDKVIRAARVAVTE